MSSKELLVVCSDEHPRKVQMLKVLTVGLVSGRTENLGCWPPGLGGGDGEERASFAKPRLDFMKKMLQPILLSFIPSSRT